MKRVLKQLLRGGFFYNFSQIHDRNVVRKIIDYAEVVGYENLCQPHVTLQIFQQI